MKRAVWTLLLGASLPLLGRASAAKSPGPEKHLFVWAGDQARKA